MADVAVEFVDGGNVRIGTTVRAVAPRAGGGFVLDGVEIRPLPLAERAQLLAAVDDGSVAEGLAERVAEMVGAAATDSALKERSHEIDALALHLAGASGDGPLRGTELLTGRALGSAQAARLTAAEADLLAASLHDALNVGAASSGDTGWTTIEFADLESTENPVAAGETSSAVRLRLAKNLIGRHRAPLPPELVEFALRAEQPQAHSPAGPERFGPHHDTPLPILTERAEPTSGGEHNDGGRWNLPLGRVSSAIAASEPDADPRSVSGVAAFDGDSATGPTPVTSRRYRSPATPSGTVGGAASDHGGEQVFDRAVSASPTADRWIDATTSAARLATESAPGSAASAPVTESGTMPRPWTVRPGWPTWPSDAASTAAAAPAPATGRELRDQTDGPRHPSQLAHPATVAPADASTMATALHRAADLRGVPR